MEQTKKNNPAAEMPPTEDVVQKGQEELRQTTINRSRLVISEDELGSLFMGSFIELIKDRGQEFQDPKGQIEQALFYASRAVLDTKCAGVLISGKSGSGKTTLINSINAILKPISESGMYSYNAEASTITNISMIDLMLYGDTLYDTSDYFSDFLLIDDLGWECTFKDYYREKCLQAKLGAILQKRYDLRKPTIIASMFDAVSMGKDYSHTIRDIIYDSYLVADLDDRFRKSKP